MSRLFYHVMQDNAGNLLFDVSGTMRLAGSGTLATIYGDEELTVILPNPMTNHPSYGSFKCFLGAGAYDFYMAKSGYTFETLTGVQGHGTMAQQDAASVAITGGSVAGLTSLAVTGTSALAGLVGIGSAPSAGFVCRFAPGKTLLASGSFLGVNVDPAYPLDVTGNTRLTGTLGLGTAPGGHAITLRYDKTATMGLEIQPSTSDAGGGAPVRFMNQAGSAIGSITATGAAVAYNTTSDSRLKHAITPLTGALDVVRAIRPVAFRWRSDGTPGRGFLADEVQALVPDAITGDAGAVDEAGGIVPQQIDHSKLVVYLVGACRELADQVESLTARLEACGG